MCSRTGVLPWREKSTSHSCKQQYGLCERHQLAPQSLDFSAGVLGASASVCLSCLGSVCPGGIWKGPTWNLPEADPETRILMRELWLRTNAGSALGMWGAGPGRERPEEAVRSCTLRVRRAAEEAVVAGGLCPGATHPAALSPPPRPWQDRSESPLLQDAPGTCCVEDTGRN
uniref:Uncharacterized protein LOC117313645 isoform X2 n=1 Tax=Tursiops truncatus TaxID=9739 RepID=A0A6J3RY47_TURTR|nr:uncharacterized protein LOC117313645 isoform X2 [Tursiops truncatus]